MREAILASRAQIRIALGGAGINDPVIMDRHERDPDTDGDSYRMRQARAKGGITLAKT